MDYNVFFYICEIYFENVVFIFFLYILHTKPENSLSIAVIFILLLLLFYVSNDIIVLKYRSLSPATLIFFFFKLNGFRQTKIHNIGAKLVGVDKFGNKYYENLDVQCG